MYIRRKVFSLLQDEDGEERYFSTTDYELLDDYDYDYDERFYADSDEDEDEGKKKSHLGRNIALAAGGTLVAVPGLYQGGRALEKVIDKKRIAKLEKAEEQTEKIQKKIEKLKKRVEDNKVDKFGKEKVQGGVVKGAKWVGKQGKDFGNWVAKQWKGGEKGRKGLNRTLMIATPVVAAGATYGAVKGIKALKNRKKDDEKNEK